MKYSKKMKFGSPFVSPKSSKTLKYRRKRNKVAIWVLILIIIVCIVRLAIFSTYPIIEDVSRNLMEIKSAEIINDVVAESISRISYGDLAEITYNEQGQITSVVANTAFLNALKSSLTLKILENLEKTGSEGFEIPLGNLTDIIFLSGVGPHIPFRIVPYGSVNVDFKDSFTSAGINQTKHEIYIEITANMNAISAVSRVRGTVNTSVMAAQTVIVGEVPQWYGSNVIR